MHLGIDFGTTRTVVAFADRGNYPVVSFFDRDGDAHDFFPTVATVRPDGSIDYGLAALDDEPGVRFRSFKRALAAPDASIATTITQQGVTVNLMDLLVGFISALREALMTESTIADILQEDPLETALVAVPAHANSAQRVMTLEAFQRAGFPVVGMMNEPSAAGFEYTHRQERTITSHRTRVIVYDLGGGTFDASLVEVRNHDHDVIDSVGVNQLGGDDFDAVLAECALKAAGVDRSELSEAEYAALISQAQEAKEMLSPQSRRVVVDVRDTTVTVPAKEFYAALEPMIKQSIDVASQLVAGAHSEEALSDIAGVYVAGGASALPTVPRLLRERFGRRVHRAPSPAASTAIGLAIAADPHSGYTITDRLSRGFGVFREWDAGRRVAFDPIISRHETLPAAGKVQMIRRYRPVHNIGWFRFAEHTDLDADGQPIGEIAPFGEIVFPFDPALRDGRDLRNEPVRRFDDAPVIEEVYTIDANGIVHVDIKDASAGYSCSYWLGAPGQTHKASRAAD